MASYYWTKDNNSDLKISIEGRVAFLNHIPKWRFITRYKMMKLLLKRYGLK